MREGRLEPIGRGLYSCPEIGRLGPRPARPEDVVRAFLDGAPFLFTGPHVWNALDLGSTVLFNAKTIYNAKREGLYRLGGRRYVFRRRPFPEAPSLEWFVIDALNNADLLDVDETRIRRGLRAALARGRFDPGGLKSEAEKYGSERAKFLVTASLSASDAAA